MKAIVIYDGENGGGIDIFERNTYPEILKVVIKRHIGPTRAITIRTLLRKLDDFNGDGCDFVFSIIIDGELYFCGINPEFLK